MGKRERKNLLDLHVIDGGDFNFNDTRALDVTLRALRGVLAAHFARLVKPVRLDAPGLTADKHLQGRWLAVANQLKRTNLNEQKEQSMLTNQTTIFLSCSYT